MGSDDTTTVLSGPGTEAAVIAELAQEAAEAEVLDPDELLLVARPDSRVVDLERHLTRPRRKRGTIAVHTGESLAAYVNAHTEGLHTAVYADVEARKVVAVLNGHQQHDEDDPGVDVHAGWADHRASLQLRHPPEWTAWKLKSGELLGQVAFAEHVEDNVADVVDPPGAELLELAQTFQANSKANFKSHRMLDSGETQLVYEENIEAKAGHRGQITVPREFTLGLAPFEGCEPYKITARLRYRVRDGQLAIGYTLVRPEDIIRAAFNDILERVESDTGLTAYHAAAPDALHPGATR